MSNTDFPLHSNGSYHSSGGIILPDWMVGSARDDIAGNAQASIIQNRTTEASHNNNFFQQNQTNSQYYEPLGGAYEHESYLGITINRSQQRRMSSSSLPPSFTSTPMGHGSGFSHSLGGQSQSQIVAVDRLSQMPPRMYSSNFPRSSNDIVPPMVAFDRQSCTFTHHSLHTNDPYGVRHSSNVTQNGAFAYEAGINDTSTSIPSLSTNAQGRQSFQEQELSMHGHLHSNQSYGNRHFPTLQEQFFNPHNPVHTYDNAMGAVAFSEPVASRVEQNRRQKKGEWYTVEGIELCADGESSTHLIKLNYEGNGNLVSIHTDAGSYVRYRCSLNGCGFEVRRKLLPCQRWAVQLRRGMPIHDHEVPSNALPYHLHHKVTTMLEESNGTARPKTIYRKLCSEHPYEPSLSGVAGEHAQVVITNMTNNYRRSNNSNALRYRYDLVHWRDKKALVLPPRYISRSDYNSAKELAAALGIANVDEMFTLNWSRDIGQRLVSLERGEETLADTTMVTSVSDIFNVLLMTRNIPSKQWSLHADGTHMVTFDGRVLIPIGTGDFRWRPMQRRFTESFRPFVHGWTGGERKVAVRLLVATLSQWTGHLYGIDLKNNIMFTVSDLADAFVLGFKEELPRSTQIICYTHAKRGLTEKKAALDKLRDRKNLTIIEDDIYLIHLCGSTAMFEAVRPLILTKWSSELGEPDFAAHAEAEYLCDTKCKWYIGATKAVKPLKPSSNSPEVYNLAMKGGAGHDGMMKINVSREQCVEQEFPKLFRHNAMERNDVGIRYPEDGNEIDSFTSGLMLLMTPSVDVVKSNVEPETWYANTPSNFGKEIQPADIESYRKALAGDSEYFCRDVMKMLYAGTRLCIVEKNESGKYIGTCELCCKKLSCPAVWSVRESEKDLTLLPRRLQEPMGDRKKGARHPPRKLLGGLNICSSQIITLPKDKTVENYFNNIQSKEELIKFCKMLRLPYSGRTIPALRRQIVAFHETVSMSAEEKDKYSRKRKTGKAKNDNAAALATQWGQVSHGVSSSSRSNDEQSDDSTASPVVTTKSGRHVRKKKYYGE